MLGNTEALTFTLYKYVAAAANIGSLEEQEELSWHQNMWYKWKCN